MPVRVFLTTEKEYRFKNVDIKAEVVLDGKKTIVPVNTGDKYNQAFAWDHILPADSFLIRRYPPPPPKKKKLPNNERKRP
jgi:hypothetical protein